MIAKIYSSAGVLNGILKSFSDVVSAEDNLEMDLNMVANTDDSIEIYLRHMNDLQILHRIESDEEINVGVNEQRKFVFSSETLQSLLSATDSEMVRVHFYEDDFKVKTQDGWFSLEPTFELPLFTKAAFRDPVKTTSFEYITDISVSHLKGKLDMMCIISPEVEIEIDEKKFWLRVADAVQGQGRTMHTLEDVPELDGFSRRYEIRPLQNFISNVKSDDVEIHLAEKGAILIRSKSGGVTSEFMSAHRMEPSY